MQMSFPNEAPLARTTDPDSSHLAAEEITESGLRDTQKAAVLDALSCQREPVTSAELTPFLFTRDRYMASRRLPDLERDGLVKRGPMRKCLVSGRIAITWSATKGEQ